MLQNIVKWMTTIIVVGLCFSCNQTQTKEGGTIDEVKEQTETTTAERILGNPDYLAISYGGYREKSRDIQPTVEQLKEDMQILHAMGVRVLRTYNTELKHAWNVLEAIQQLKQEKKDFEMYVMVGAWINCENAWTEKPNHYTEDPEYNAGEVGRAVEMANKYPDIVKMLAVGNEAMVKWAAGYHVQAGVILKWVNHLQDLKQNGELPKDLWITSSDNFASWGGGDTVYHKKDLVELIKAVDFISLHTYPMHDTHYNPDFWGISQNEAELADTEKIEKAMVRAKDYAISQYYKVQKYVEGLGIEKPMHIGETGWATYSNEFYGMEGTKATDEFKEGLYYKYMREWTAKEGIACFYFEAFDEIWKDAENPEGSENHFGLFSIDGQAKYALWDLVDQGVFEGLTRGNNPITKTYDGNKQALIQEVALPPTKEKFEWKMTLTSN